MNNRFFDIAKYIAEGKSQGELELNLIIIVNALEAALGGYIPSVTKQGSAIKMSRAKRQQEKFRALYSDTVYGIFTDFEDVSCQKMSALFNRTTNTKKLSARGLTKRLTKFCDTVNTDLLEEECRYVEENLLYRTAVSRVLGRAFFKPDSLTPEQSERVLSEVEKIKSSLCDVLSESLLAPFSSKYFVFEELYPILKSSGYFHNDRVAKEHITHFISVLLLLALNLYEDTNDEHHMLLEVIKAYVLSTVATEEKKEQKKADESLTEISSDEIIRIAADFFAAAHALGKSKKSVSPRVLRHLLDEAIGTEDEPTAKESDIEEK